MKKDQIEPGRLNGAAALLDDIIEKAVSIRASDIHLEPQEHNLKIRYRVDGILLNGITVHRCMIQPLITRLKVIVNLDIGESRLPQDGKTHLKILEHELDLRVSTLPTIFGEKAVIRILMKDQVMLSLDELGMEKEISGNFKNVILKSSGLILVTGPTGSGKTTTLYAALNRINSSEKNIVTIEDPVEYQIQNINQTQVNYKSGYSFERGLRSILRQDPDVIMIGEIRDRETARIALQASMTGHLVFSTLHTNSSVSAIDRLLDMGIEPYLIASSLMCVLAQRLLRKTCIKCKECSYSGYRGRVGVYELLLMNDNLKSLILRNANRDEIERTANAKGLLQAGLDLAASGVTTKEEVLRVICD